MKRPGIFRNFTELLMSLTRGLWCSPLVDSQLLQKGDLGDEREVTPLLTRWRGSKLHWVGTEATDIATTDAFYLGDLLPPSLRVGWWKLYACCFVISSQWQGKLPVSTCYSLSKCCCFQEHKEYYTCHSGNWLCSTIIFAAVCTTARLHWRGLIWCCSTLMKEFW